MMVDALKLHLDVSMMDQYVSVAKPHSSIIKDQQLAQSMDVNNTIKMDVHHVSHHLSIVMEIV